MTRLVVFADDWGVHPSSCQHLIRQLLSRYPTLWVNTIGMRRPRFTIVDFQTGLRRITRWTTRPRLVGAATSNLHVIAPPMWPGFRSPWQRRLNARLLSASVNPALGPRHGERRIAVTTIPIVGDLVGRLDVDRWVYCCVDDFASWPGLDGEAIRALEETLVPRVDCVIAVSEPLRTHLARLGRTATLLTHGVNLADWAAPASSAPLPAWWAALARPIYLFWGLVDRRLDIEWCRALAQAPGTLVLVGPHQAPGAAVRGAVAPGPVAYGQLPRLASAADVLVMPYADLPVTRAAQFLKLKEYLATSKPVVVRSLPYTREWSDAADVVDTREQFLQVVQNRARSGAPAAQLEARQRLKTEGWPAKANLFEQLILGTTD
jgi:hypothetical protein